MKTTLLISASALALGCAHAQPQRERAVQSPTQTPAAMTALESALRTRIASEDSATIAVSLIDLATGRELHINGDTMFHAASTMKVPVLLALFARADKEPGLLEKKIPVVNSFKSIADTSHFTLDPGDDSDSLVYKLIGDSADLRYLANRMIVRSSNFATNLLIDVLTPAAIRATLDRAGVRGVQVLRGVEDNAAFAKGMNNTTSSRGMALALDAIARCTVTSRHACDEMVQILSGQEFNEMIPAGLPAGTKVAHKTGWITKVQHDAAIVFPPNRAPYVLVVLTKGIGNTTTAAKAVADISRTVWDAVTNPAWAHADGALQGNTADLADLQVRYRVTELGRRRFTHENYWRVLEPIVQAPLESEKVGDSAEGRAIRLVRFGHGPTKVFLWSQMHGDESTATMALADLMKYMQKGGDARLKTWSDRLTILMIPMLNPDGAEWFVRHNAFGIDINRDARNLSTPEARILKSVRDRYSPDFGFNLHDQNARTRVGDTDALAAIALLAPAPDSSGKVGAVQLRAKQLAALVRDAIEPFVGGHVTKYDDTFNPRAFGDNIQRWGTSTVLIESGGWKNDPEKQYLRTVNFAALVTAFDAIASGQYAQADVQRYESLLMNGENAVDLLVKGGTVVVPGLQPYRADISIVGNDNGSASVTEIGDLRAVTARDTVDADGLFLHPARDVLRRQADAAHARLMPNTFPLFTLRRGPTEASDAVYIINGANVTKLSAADIRPSEAPHAAVGCYDLQIGEWSPARGQRNDEPRQLRLLWTYGTERFERGKLLVRTIAAAQDNMRRYMTWRAQSPEAIEVTVGNGFWGFVLKLTRAGNDWKGTATSFSDAVTVGRADPVAPAVLKRMECPTD